MDAKKFIMAALAGGVTLFVLGGIFYAILLADFFNSAAGDSVGTYRQEPIFWAILVGELCAAALVTLIFGRWASISTFAGGAKAGAIFGVLLSLSFGLTMYGTTTLMSMAAVLVDPIVNLIRYVVAGGVIGWVLGRK